MIAENCSKGLGIIELYQYICNKLDQLKKGCRKYKVTPEEVTYIGYDLNDLKCIEYCELSACSNDAVE